MSENRQINLPTCAGCGQPFSWDEAYQHQDTPGSAPYNPPGHGIFRPRAYCPNCGALVAEWHIDQLKDYDEWAWYGNNASRNAGKPLPPSPIYLWGKGIPVQFIPKFEEHRLALDEGGLPIAGGEGSGRIVGSSIADVPDVGTAPSTEGVLVGHSEGIGSCAVSPDGAWIVSSAGGYPKPGDLKVWKVATGACLYTFSGQTTPVANPLAVGPDGTWFVSAGGSMAAKEFVLRIWDVATGSCRHVLTGHTDWVQDCAVAPDGTWLVSASSDRSLRIWDVATGICGKVLRGHEGGVYVCTVSPDGSWIVSTGDDGTLRIWDVATGACRHVLVGHTDGDIKTGFAEVHACAVSPDGTWVVSGGGDGTLRIWDVATGTCRHVLVGHTDAVFYVSVSPDGKWIVSGSNPVIHGKDLDLRIWDSRTGACLHVLHGHTRWVNAVAISPDGQWVVSASRDQTLRIWDPQTGTCLRSLVGHDGGVASVAVSPDSTWIVSTSYDKTLRIWDVATGTCRLPRSPGSVTAPTLPTLGALDQAPAPVASTPRSQPDLPGEPVVIEETLSLTAHKKGRPTDPPTTITSLAITRDGRRAVTGSWDATLKVWDTGTWELLHTLDASRPPTPELVLGQIVDTNANWINCVALTPDDKFAVAGSNDNLIRVWDLESGLLVRTLSGHLGHPTAVAVTPDGRRLVSGAQSSAVLESGRVWDLATGAQLLTLQGAQMINAVAITPDGRLAVCAMFGEPLTIWDLATGAILRRLRGGEGALAVAITADGLGIVSGEKDGSVKLWEIASGTEVRSMVGHHKALLQHPVAVTPDGRLVISGASSGLFAWELASGRQVCSFVGNLVTALAVTPDGCTLLSACDDFFEGSLIKRHPLPKPGPASVPEPLPEPVVTGTTSPAQAHTTTAIRSLDEIVDEIMTLDRQMNELYAQGKQKSDPEWRRCDDRLTAIGEELYALGGEGRMQAALQLAYQKGLRGRYAERHWTGIGSWMG